jgi:hypothetical protein
LTATATDQKMTVDAKTREMLMKFVQRGSEWLLIDETAPKDACVIATLRT